MLAAEVVVAEVVPGTGPELLVVSEPHMLKAAEERYGLARWAAEKLAVASSAEAARWEDPHFRGRSLEVRGVGFEGQDLVRPLAGSGLRRRS